MIRGTRASFQRGRPSTAGGPVHQKGGFMSSSIRRGWRGFAMALATWAVLSGGSARAACTVDAQGADDQKVANQSDLNQFCSGDSCGSGGTTISWSWDNTSWPGSNTGDACALF